MPLEQIPGNVYVLHYDVPQRVKSVSRDYAGPNAVPGPGGLVSAKPIRHYVGWSQQADPRKRIYNHGPAALREIVYLESGTMVDELGLKVVGKCPKCGERYAEDLVPGARRAATLRLLKLAHAATGEDAARLRGLSPARRETGQEIAASRPGRGATRSRGISGINSLELAARPISPTHRVCR